MIDQIFQYLSVKTNIPCRNEEYSASSAAVELKKHNAVLLKNIESRSITEPGYYSTLKSILDKVQLDQTQYIFRLFELVRNQSAQVKSNQDMFVESGLWKRSIEIIESVSDPATIRMGIQMLTNLMTDNSNTQNILWKHIVESKVLSIGLSSTEDKTLKSMLIGIYNCTHNDKASNVLLFSNKNSSEILNLVLKTTNDFVQDEQDITFELSIAILTGFLELDKLPGMWEEIRGIQLQICLLKVLDGIFHSEIDFQKLEMSKTSLYLLDVLKQSLEIIESVRDFEQIEQQTKDTLLIAFYILQYWCIISEKVPQQSDKLHEILSYVREISVFCTRNMLENNQENQDLIDGMEAVGIEDNLQEFGVEARLENGKIKIKKNKQ
ncbi:hypothetical protein HDV01_000180 [Terramyces sp. JEL0728]|nr:hypothetical protein HDV01_000180 [Terramyces sp. JEL0728]